MTLIKQLENRKKKILLAGAHPDDVEFSTGRLILRRKAQNTSIICVTDGRKGQEGTDTDVILPEDEYAKLRIKESQKALNILGLNENSSYFLNIPDQKLISNPYIIDKISLIIKKEQPDFLLIPPWEGAHPDHDTTHLFLLIAAKNISYPFDNIVEYGSYNNYKGKFRVQEFIPFAVNEEKLTPSEKEQNTWKKAMSEFKSQKNQQAYYIPKSTFENYRRLPKYDYKKLPYSKSHIKVIRELLNPIYPIAQKIIPRKDKLFYETWKNSINPENIKKKLNHYIEHYEIKKQ